MSLAQIGASLLAEVEELPLDEVLSKIRHDLNPSLHCYFGLPEVDQLLHAIHEPVPHITQDGAELMLGSSNEISDEESQTRSLPAHGRTDLTRATRPQNALIEISSALDENESVDLCYFLIAASVIGDDEKQRHNCVVWLDTEIDFNAARLHQVCNKYLCDKQPKLPPYQREVIIREALRHIHVISIHSSSKLLSVLTMLPDYLLGSTGYHTDDPSANMSQRHHSAHRQLALIVLNSATAFYWPDRFNAEIAHLEAGTSTTKSTRPLETTTSQIITQLKSLQTTFECSIIYVTSNPIFSVPPHHHQNNPIHRQQPQPQPHPYPQPHTTQPNGPQHQKDHTPTIFPQNPTLPTLSPWTKSATLSLTLSRIPTPQFAHHMTLQACHLDKHKRAEIQRQARTRTTINPLWFERVLSDPEVKGVLDRIDDRGSFVIRCSSDGVEIEMER